MIYLIYCLNIVAIILTVIVCYRQTSLQLQRYFVIGLFLKMISGIIYGEIYMEYYKKGDTINYFNKGIKLSSYGKEDFTSYIEFVIFDKKAENIPVEYSSITNPRSLFIIKIASVFFLFTYNSYWLTSCYFSLLSFLGVFYLMKILLTVYSEYRKALFISFLFSPSFIFWSSGLTKESIAIGSLFFMMAIVIKLMHKIRIAWWEIIVFPITVLVLLKLRSFYLLVFILTFGVYAAVHIIGRNIKYKMLSWVATGAIIAIIVIWVWKLPYVLSIDNFLDHLYYSYEKNFLRNPENAIIYYDLKPNFQSVLFNTPLAIFSGLFRPLIFDAKKVVIILPALENSLLLLLFIIKVPHFFKNWNWFDTVSWLYILILAAFLALSTPNFGSLMRYKVAFLPVLLFLLLKENPLFSKWRIVGKKKDERERKMTC